MRQAPCPQPGVWIESKLLEMVNLLPLGQNDMSANCVIACKGSKIISNRSFFLSDLKKWYIWTTVFINKNHIKYLYVFYFSYLLSNWLTSLYFAYHFRFKFDMNILFAWITELCGIPNFWHQVIHFCIFFFLICSSLSYLLLLSMR